MVLVSSIVGSSSWIRAKKGREDYVVIIPGEMQNAALRKDSLGEETPWWPRSSMG